MLEQEVPVTFDPPGKTVYVLQGTRLLEAAAVAGITLEAPCGGEGKCGKCKVIVRRGACEPTTAEGEAFSPEELEQGLRLACQTLVCGPAVVDIPETSRLASHHKILSHTEGTSPAVADPAIRKRHVELSPPDRDSHEPDLFRLESALGPLEVDLEVLQEMPGLLRQTHFRGTAVLAGKRLIDFEPGNTESESYAIALDLGTTTLVGMLLEMDSGRELAVTSRINPQTRFGDDVLSRINHVRQTSQGLQELHDIVIEAVDEMIGELADQSGVRRERVYELAVSGNTTMQQLLLRIDPRWLGEVPFVPATGHYVLSAAAALGLHIHPRGRVYVLPVIGGFVGGDTASGILACELAQSQGPTLLVDVGTNGEIVLCCEGILAAAATAAGPAFEGARIYHGMRASDGAIEKVVVDGTLRTNVVGSVSPVGLCGSALIDLAAELLRHGVLTARGRLHTPAELPKQLPEDLRRRLVSHDRHAAFMLAEAGETGTAKPILVTQADFRELQLATGAIRAGIVILLQRFGLQPADLEKVLIAGGFGNFIRRSNAQRIGLLPPEIRRNRIRYQGNTSLAGARLVAVSRQARQQVEELAGRTQHVDLSRQAGFQDAFAEAMIFPEDKGL